MNKIDLSQKKIDGIEKDLEGCSQEQFCISFTDLFQIKRVGLVKLLEKHGVVYIIGNGAVPLKVTMATFF